MLANSQTVFTSGTRSIRETVYATIQSHFPHLHIFISLIAYHQCSRSLIIYQRSCCLWNWYHKDDFRKLKYIKLLEVGNIFKIEEKKTWMVNHKTVLYCLARNSSRSTPISNTLVMLVIVYKDTWPNCSYSFLIKKTDICPVIDFPPKKRKKEKNFRYGLNTNYQKGNGNCLRF